MMYYGLVVEGIQFSFLDVLFVSILSGFNTFTS